jgi:hypothetical protein
LLVTTAVGALAEMPVYDKMTLEIYAHSSVLMEQAAADIWPFVIDPNSWKQGLKLRHVDGEQNQVGQVFAALASPGDATPQLYVKNVEVIPNQLRTIKLMSPDDGATVGYSSWVLEESYGMTRVSYHVYVSMPLPEEAVVNMSAEQIADMKARQQAENAARYKDELLALKAAVEAH